MVQHLYSATNKKTDAFTQILLTHPAIFMVEYALMQVMLENHIEPDKVLGTSLGEIYSSRHHRCLRY